METIELVVKGLFKGYECELKKRTDETVTYSISMDNNKMALTKKQAEKACKLLKFKTMYIR